MFHKRDRFNLLKDPKFAYATYLELVRLKGTQRTWKQTCAAYRKRLRKAKIAKLSRRRNRR